jgi:hypothetical protein
VWLLDDKLYSAAAAATGPTTAIIRRRSQIKTWSLMTYLKSSSRVSSPGILIIVVVDACMHGLLSLE